LGIFTDIVWIFSRIKFGYCHGYSLDIVTDIVWTDGPSLYNTSMSILMKIHSRNLHFVTCGRMDHQRMCRQWHREVCRCIF